MHHLIKNKRSFFALTLLLLPFIGYGQSATTLETASLANVIQYTLEHSPAIQQSRIDENITNKAIKGRLADWLPQVNFTYNYQRFIDLQTSVIGGNVIRFGVDNTSSAQFTATQTIFNRDVLLASSTASRINTQAEQTTAKVSIDAIVNVTKAFYDVLATTQQINVNQESIARLERSLKDAYSRYQSGIADKTDYKRATILLNNAKAALKASREQLTYRSKALNTLMGYPADQQINLVYDTAELAQDILIDTTQTVNLTSHIDYRILYMQKELQEANVRYSQWAFLPSLNAFGAYNLNYQNNDFGELYNQKYPYSYVGLTLAVPIMQGGKRILKVQENKLGSKRLDVSLGNLENSLRTEYTRSLSAYKTNLENYFSQRENVQLAEEVYEVINLQYKSGVRTYLDVTIAETDLRTTRLNYINSLYQVLASKMDVLRALGQITY
jgi:outer membrane protein